jgi:hypothetical protein
VQVGATPPGDLTSEQEGNSVDDVGGQKPEGTA